MNVFEDINKQGTTIIMTTHNKEFIEHTTKRVIVIDNGSILRDQKGQAIAR